MTGLIVNDGRIMQCYALTAARNYGYPTHCQAGTGTTPAAQTDTALQIPYGSRVALTSITVNTTAKTITFLGRVTATGSVTITEYGAFTALAGGYLACREVQTGIALAPTEYVDFQFVWQY